MEPLASADISSGHDCSSDAETEPVSSNRFKKPFKIYENFRSVYKGVQRKKGVSISYDLTEAAAAAAGHDDDDTVVPIARNETVAVHSRQHSSSSSSEDKKNYSSLDSCLTNNSSCTSDGSGDKPKKRSSPTLDGNSTDDSGIDSISTPEPKNIATDPHVYSKVSLSTKKKNKMASAPSPEEEKGESHEGGGTVIKLVDGIDIGESSTDPPGEINEKKISMETLSKNDISDIYELTTLLNNTTALLTRNSSLRASLTISVKNPKNGKSNEQTFILPSGNTKKASDSVWDKSEVAAKTEESEVTVVTVNLEEPPTVTEEDFPSLVDLDGAPNPSFVRHNPARRPVSEVKTGNLPDPVCRRSIRLAPKTVANLASKYDALLYNKAQVSTVPEQEKKLLKKKDITKIIGSLNKLDEDAKRSCYRPRPMTASGKWATTSNDVALATTEKAESGRRNQKNVSVGTNLCEKSPGHMASEDSKCVSPPAAAAAHFAVLQQKPTVHFATVSVVQVETDTEVEKFAIATDGGDGETDRKPTVVNECSETFANEDNSNRRTNLTDKYIRSLASFAAADVDTITRSTDNCTSSGSTETFEFLAGKTNNTWATAVPAIVKEEDDSSDISSSDPKADPYDSSSLYESIGGSDKDSKGASEEDHYEKVNNLHSLMSSSDDVDWVDVEDRDEEQAAPPLATTNPTTSRQHFVR